MNSHWSIVRRRVVQDRWVLTTPAIQPLHRGQAFERDAHTERHGGQHVTDGITKDAERPGPHPLEPRQCCLGVGGHRPSALWYLAPEYVAEAVSREVPIGIGLTSVLQQDVLDQVEGDFGRLVTVDDDRTGVAKQRETPSATRHTRVYSLWGMASVR